MKELYIQNHIQSIGNTQLYHTDFFSVYQYPKELKGSRDTSQNILLIEEKFQYCNSDIRSEYEAIVLSYRLFIL